MSQSRVQQDDVSYTYQCSEDASNPHTQHINSQRNKFKETCDHFNACVQQLLDMENPLVVISGSSLSLNTTCSLINQNGPEVSGNFTGKCTQHDRSSIHEIIEKQLEEKLESNDWKNVRSCLKNNYKEQELASPVDQICGLAHNKSKICMVQFPNVHTRVETFLNKEIDRVRCACQVFMTDKETSFNFLPIIVGTAIGLILLLLIICLGYFCYRYKKLHKRVKQSPSVIYVPAKNSDNIPVYQEILDDRGYQVLKPANSLSPPSLPARYLPGASKMAGPSSMAPFATMEDDFGYLEPVEAGSRYRTRQPTPGQANLSYDAPPKYQEKDTTSEDADNNYFDPLPGPPDEDDKAHEMLETRTIDSKMAEPDNQMAENSVLGSPSFGGPLGPVPAKRTKKEDRQTESQYFVLEQDGTIVEDSVS